MWEPSVLSVDGLEVRYGAYITISGVSFSVAAGEVVCLMGHNGSGKSSLMNAVSGLIRPHSGTISFAGERIDETPTPRLLERGLAHVLERRRLFPYMTVEENLLLGAYLPQLRKRRAESLAEMFARFAILRERRRQLAATLSGGEQQQVSIARARLGRPKFLMLDEPFLGLSPRLVSQISMTIQRLNAGGITILFTEQNIQQSLRISHRGYILESGRVAMEGEARDLLADERLHQIYLGLQPVDPRVRAVAAQV
jgi:branched-chain amino acid transport system ATP-binding protein